MTRKRLMKLLMGLMLDRDSAKAMRLISKYCIEGDNYTHRACFEGSLEAAANAVPFFFGYHEKAIDAFEKHKAGKISDGEAVKIIGNLVRMTSGTCAVNINRK